MSSFVRLQKGGVMKSWRNAGKIFVCRKCGYKVRSHEEPGPLRWSNGHVCFFSSKRQEAE